MRDSIGPRIYLRDRVSGLFLSHGGLWSNNEEEARRFPNALSAVAYCYCRHIGTAEIVVKADAPDEEDTVVLVARRKFDVEESYLPAWRLNWSPPQDVM